MTRQRQIFAAVALAMMAAVAALLLHTKAHQKLGLPGIRTSPIAGSQRLDIELPEKVLHYGSTNIPTDPLVLTSLSQDTSFAQRQYTSPGNQFDTLDLMVVLMGTDRTSIHKPQYCLKGIGWDLDVQNEVAETVPMDLPYHYDLPVAKLTMQRSGLLDGQNVQYSGIYLYWYVADGQLTRSHFYRNLRTTTHLLKTGELDRWAYIGCLAVCKPGEEAATLARMKKFIAAAVPEFQIAAGPRVGGEPAQTASR
jgi:hypothetical protein